LTTNSTTPKIRTLNIQYAVRVDLTVEVDDEGNTTRIVSASALYIGDNDPGEDAFDTSGDGWWRNATQAEWDAGRRVLNDLGVLNDY